MDQYKTVLEISSSWGVSTKTVQNLCANGEIDGAVKRAGSWFIPCGASNPLIGAYSNRLDFVGTKKKIFDSAIDLFMSYGYENVSIKDIADAVGIMQSAIYNHFPSKQKILDTMYDYYLEHFGDNVIPVEEMKHILKNASKEEFCSALIFTFESNNPEKYKRMLLITKIVYMRIFQDESARDIFLSKMSAELGEYVKEILNYGISLGILEEFDVLTFSDILIGQRHIMGVKAYVAPDYEPKQLEEEMRLMNMVMELLPFRAKEEQA